MPRKGLRPRDKRALPPADYKYNSVLVARFINKINFEGNGLLLFSRKNEKLIALGSVELE